MARSSRRSSRSSNRSRRSGSRSSSSKRNRALIFGAVALISALLVLTHASEPHHADNLTTAADTPEDTFPATFDETKLGADLLPINTSSPRKSNTSIAAVLSRLKSSFGRLLPSSDVACDWSWVQLKCAPSESCKFKPRLGDLHLGRSCRLRTKETEKEGEKEGRRERRALKLVKAAWAGVVEGVGCVWLKVDRVRDRGVHHTVRGFKAAVGNLKAKLPDTDKECKFDVIKSVAQRKMVCEPAESCVFQFKAGDMMMDRACRLK